MRRATTVSLALSALGMAGEARATWVTIPLVRTPTDAGRYVIAVSHAPKPRGGMRYVVTLTLKGGAWPQRILPALTKVTVKPHSLESAEKRRLVFATKGNVRTLAFDVSKAEAARWHFQLDEYGEANGHLMPSVNSYLFPLNRPPQTSR